jgi:hypothetical protein
MAQGNAPEHCCRASLFVSERTFVISGQDMLFEVAPRSFYFLELSFLLVGRANATTFVENLAMLMQDLRFAFRQFRKNPGFGLTAVLMLASGIGATLAIFAFVDAALIKPIKPLLFANATRMVEVTEIGGFFRRANLSYLHYID